METRPAGKRRSLRIEDYALIGDCETAALVGNNGSIDWLCVPRFDSPACFAALLGTKDNGHWQIAPLDADGGVTVKRRYREGTLILETEFETRTGAVRVIDSMPLHDERSNIVRIVEGLRGTVSMETRLVIRFDYGSVVPWVRQVDGSVVAVAGPDTLSLRTPVETHGEDFTTLGAFDVKAGDRVPFVLEHRRSHLEALEPIDAETALEEAEKNWSEWSKRCNAPEKWKPAVLRSLITLKALTYTPSGGVIAAATTSLPECFGGIRNWDYRFCWVRDATFTLNAMLLSGYTEEANAWREWLLRAVAGKPEDLQILYSVTGERRLEESELTWLEGFANSRPVRVGNAATKQFQLDVYGEVMETLHLSRAAGLEADPHVWHIQRKLLEFLTTKWKEPDEGLWEIRGPRQHFVHSKVMAWVAFDRGIKDAQTFKLEGPIDEWRRIRDEIHAQVCTSGFDHERNTFVQHYGTRELDASCLLIPLVGFLPGDDPRVHGTIDAIERELKSNGFVLRYKTQSGVDGLSGGEGAFLPCSFWLADALAVSGRRADAEKLFTELVALVNDVGLLSEEVDPTSRTFLGNFPQALTHMALVNTARLLNERPILKA